MVLTTTLPPTPCATTTDANKAAVRMGIETLFNRRNLAAAPRFWADDLVVHVPSEPEPLYGREVAIDQLFSKVQAAFPDLRIVVDEAIAEGDSVVVRWTSYGTHRGDYFGLPPTGRAVAVRELAIFRYADGKAREIWLMPDALGTMQQLGMMGAGPPPRLLVLVMGGIRRLGGLREQLAAMRLALRWMATR